jgi:ribosome-associated translation inhibitor RaiA
MYPREGLEKGALVHNPTRHLGIPVSGLMDPDINACRPNEEALKVLNGMWKVDKTYCLVRLWDELQGIITYRDFISLLVDQDKLDIPVYIVGLPEDPFEADLAKSKFVKEADKLYRSFLNIEEVNAVIKSKPIARNRQRYEVDVSVKTDKKKYAFREKGYDLPIIFDSITDKMKRILLKPHSKRKPRTKQKIVWER